MLFQKLSGKKSGVGTAPPAMVEDVFSSYLYTGNGADRTVGNGVNLSGYGGLCWIKSRNTISTSDHLIFDTARGNNLMLLANGTNAQSNQGAGCWSPTSSGFTVNNGFQPNYNTDQYATWTFRKAPKFFDIVTYTGNGVAGRTIAHSLGQAPGMVIIKKTSATSDWYVAARKSDGNYAISNWTTPAFFSLNTTAAAPDLGAAAGVGTATVFNLTMGGHAANSVAYTNANGATYVAYLFAHDTDATTGLIQCGSFTTDASGNATVSLGWEPQYLMIKRTDSAQNWQTFDVMRQFSHSGYAALYPNLSSAESVTTGNSYIAPTATGFKTGPIAAVSASATYIYMAIRRGPMRPPTVGTQIYNALARTGDNSASRIITGVGFAPDLILRSLRNSASGAYWWDRLRGSEKQLPSSSTAAEATGSGYGVNEFQPDGYKQGSSDGSYWNSSSYTVIDHFFRRYPGVFDEVCYTGTGADRMLAHNLGVIPELIITKARGASGVGWGVYHTLFKSLSLQYNPTSIFGTYLHTNQAWVGASMLYDLPTSTNILLSANNWNESGNTFVAYLFATLAGVSKVGSYTGNGSSQTINCGFAAGARFVLVKRTDSTGDWFVWDSARGIVAGNDPHLSLNTTAAEVTTDDSIDPDSSGFIVNQLAATNINVNAATYIFLAIA